MVPINVSIVGKANQQQTYEENVWHRRGPEFSNSLLAEENLWKEVEQNQRRNRNASC